MSPWRLLFFTLTLLVLCLYFDRASISLFRPRMMAPLPLRPCPPAPPRLFLQRACPLCLAFPLTGPFLASHPLSLVLPPSPSAVTFLDLGVFSRPLLFSLPPLSPLPFPHFAVNLFDRVKTLNCGVPLSDLLPKNPRSPSLILRAPSFDRRIVRFFSDVPRLSSILQKLRGTLLPFFTPVPGYRVHGSRRFAFGCLPHARSEALAASFRCSMGFHVGPN